MCTLLSYIQNRKLLGLLGYVTKQLMKLKCVSEIQMGVNIVCWTVVNKRYEMFTGSFDRKYREKLKIN
jgi:hypothetical protein